MNSRPRLKARNVTAWAGASAASGSPGRPPVKSRQPCKGVTQLRRAMPLPNSISWKKSTSRRSRLEMNDPVARAGAADTLETRTIVAPETVRQRSTRDSFWRLARYPLWAVFPIYASYFALLPRLPDTHAYRLGRLGYPQALWLLRR